MANSRSASRAAGKIAVRDRRLRSTEAPAKAERTERAMERSSRSRRAYKVFA